MKKQVMGIIFLLLGALVWFGWSVWEKNKDFLSLTGLRDAKVSKNKSTKKQKRETTVTFQQETYSRQTTIEVTQVAPKPLIGRTPKLGKSPKEIVRKLPVARKATKPKTSPIQKAPQVQAGKAPTKQKKKTTPFKKPKNKVAPGMPQSTQTVVAKKTTPQRSDFEIACGLHAHCQHPRWSSDGRWLSHEVRNVRQRSIILRTYDFQAKALRSVLPPLPLQLPRGPLRGVVTREMAFSPNARHFLYASNGQGTVFNLYLSGHGRLRVSDKTKHDGQPAWSADGKRVVFVSSRTGKGDLYWFSLKKMKVKRLTTDTQSTEFFPTWNPVKKLTLAYVRHTSQQDRIHIIKNVFTRKSQPLLPKNWGQRLSQLTPSWSPDGKKLAFYTVDSKNTYDLYVTTVGGIPKLIAHNVSKSDAYGPAWSPDSRKIFYVQLLPKNQDAMIAVDLQKNEKKQLPTQYKNHNELQLVKTPKGQWKLAYTARKSAKVNFRRLFVRTLQPF